MDMKQYQAQALKTAAYPAYACVLYPLLGLAGETGEVVEKFKKLIRDHAVQDLRKLPKATREELKLELGDVLWYLTNLADDLGFDLAEVAEANVAKLQDRKDRGAIQGSGDNR